MADPVINGQDFFPDAPDFASQIELSIDFGTNAGRWVLVGVVAPGSGATNDSYITGCVIDPAGANVALTSEGAADLTTFDGTTGRIKWFRLDGATVPSGTKTLRVTAADGNTKLRAYVIWGDTSSALAASAGGSFAAGTTSWSSGAVASAVGDLVVAIGYANGGGSGTLTITGTSSTSIAGDQYPDAASNERWFRASKAGAASVTLTATISGNSFTPNASGRAWNVAGTGGGGGGSASAVPLRNFPRAILNH